MKLQIITTNVAKLKKDFADFALSDISEPLSLDVFDVNIIDLTASNLWISKSNNNNTVDKIADLESINVMVEHHKRAIIVYVLPQNIEFHYAFSNGSYLKKERLKNIVPNLHSILIHSFPKKYSLPPIIYERTKTTLKETSYNADFYFEYGYGNEITVSDQSEKITTIRKEDNLFFTTLDIMSSETSLANYLMTIAPPTKSESIPELVKLIAFFDDNRLKMNIAIQEDIIKKAQGIIEDSNERLKENAFYKSILYSNGEELVAVVFPILEQILDCDLSQFKDEKKEDFLIKKSSYTFIGEIKGVTSNIKNEFISQIDVHFQGYKDKLAEEGKIEKVHQILIIKPFRNKPLQDRSPVNEEQIKLAERNGCLVIETVTLLKLFEQFKMNKIDTSFCENLFAKRTGLLTESDFYVSVNKD